ncbi:UNVERIFIED_CONTAM: hypothetical protein GTU68_053218, partial [Idotea baltica]|nr:hypothetical protein [Idotea baltica]
LSFPLSLLYALEKLETNGYKKSFINSSELKIHVIGAESAVELLGIIRWEYFLHRLPSLLKLHIVFIGPNLFKSFEMEDEFEMDKHCLDDSCSTRCEDCIKKNRVVVYEMATMLYHDYEESKHFKEPDAIIAFNCGFHEFAEDPSDTWSKSLNLITKMAIPLIFTSYTQLEAERDLKTALKSNSDIEVRIPPQLNPFCSPRPIRDPSRENEESFFFYNQYLSCIQGK